VADAPIRIFISYAHEDVELKNQLVSHLRYLELTGRATVWHDEQLDGGVEWLRRIRDELDRSQVVLLLVSPDFISSEFINEHELTEALARHDSRRARVIPVILRPCHFEGLPFSRLQAVPRFANPVTWYDDRDVAFAEVAEAIERVVDELRSGHPALQPSQRAPSEPPAAHATTVYFLAHPDDMRYCSRIRDKIHPAVLARPPGVQLIDHWDLAPGTVTSEQIHNADIVVLVMSGQMLTSPRVADAYEQVVEMYERGRVRVVVAQARRFMLASSPFQDVPTFPSADSALIDLADGAADEACYDIARALAVAIYNHRLVLDGLLVPTRRSSRDSLARSGSGAARTVVTPPSTTADAFDFLADDPMTP
jgi:hypothetical protein